jgi:hypothetical protein
MNLTSKAFKEGGEIPKKYTCDGEDISPQIMWDGVPAQTKSIALICDDPDAPGGTWVQWVIFNLPADYTELPDDIPKEKELKNKARQGVNDFGKTGYGGPCPPPGVHHRYFFKLYALDSVLELDAGAAKRQVETAMKGHILDEGKLMGKYKR